jgi:hypothetical protein
VTIAYVTSKTANSDFSSSLTFALDAGSGADRIVMVYAGTDRGGATTINSATYNGVSMSALSGVTSAVTGFDGRFFYLVGAASGSNNVVITYSDANTKPYAAAAVYSGVGGVSGAVNVVPAGLTSSISSTVSSASGDLVAMLGMQYGRASVAPSSPAVERMDAVARGVIYGFLWDEAGASSVTIDGTAPGSAEWWVAALNLQAAGGGGGGFQVAWATNANTMIQGSLQ